MPKDLTVNISIDTRSLQQSLDKIKASMETSLAKAMQDAAKAAASMVPIYTATPEVVLSLAELNRDAEEQERRREMILQAVRAGMMARGEAAALLLGEPEPPVRSCEKDPGIRAIKLRANDGQS